MMLLPLPLLFPFNGCFSMWTQPCGSASSSQVLLLHLFQLREPLEINETALFMGRMPCPCSPMVKPLGRHVQ